MMIGIDVVAVGRFRRLLERLPSFPCRFFTAAERHYCLSTADPQLRFAATFAAKEAVMKAQGLTPAPAWARRIEIVRSGGGAPVAHVGGRAIPVSISHDAGLAIAVAVAPATILPSPR
jgi:holo-[acyl-carrier protein] synthase